MAFHNPYHFVPALEGSGFDADIEREDFIKGDIDQVTHDRYFDGAKSGRIICSLTAETPFVVGGKQDDRKTPTEVEQYKLDDYPAIPASTLRGLISSIIEAATNSAMRVLDNPIYSYRKMAAPGEALSRIGIVVTSKQSGRLRLLPLCEIGRNPQGCLKINLLNPSSFKTFSLENKQFYYMKSTQHGTGEVPITEDEFNSKSISEQRGYRRGILRVMKADERAEEIPDNRLYELFITQIDKLREDLALNDYETTEIHPTAIEHFHSLADQRTEESLKSIKKELKEALEKKSNAEVIEAIKRRLLPYEPIGTRRNLGDEDDNIRLKPGGLVYFRTERFDNADKVVEVSFSAIWRGRVDDEEGNAATAFDFFGKIDSELVPAHNDRKFITIAEQMLGFVDNKDGRDMQKEEKKDICLAGRIYPSPARFLGLRKSDNSGWERVTSPDTLHILNPDDAEEWTTLKILGSPKPPSPALYFKNNDGSGAYIPKKELKPSTHQPQGRKFYLHNRSIEAEPWKSQNNENLKQKMKVKPVKANTVFYFHIDFDNLSDIELGALLYALRPTNEFRHKIGLGKPIGLGTVRIEPLGLFLVNRNERCSKQGLFAQRYAKVWKANSEAEYPWASGADLFIELKDKYVREAESIESATTISIKENYDQFRSAMDVEVRDVLELVGNPEKVIEAVHYPTVDKQSGNDETESYKWFVANDIGSKEKKTRWNPNPRKKDAARTYLKPLSKSKSATGERVLTSLDELEWLGE